MDSSTSNHSCSHLSPTVHKKLDLEIYQDTGREKDASRHVPGVNPMPLPVRALDRIPKGTEVGGGAGAAIYFLTGEGSWKLRPHERIVLEAAISTLPNHIQAALHTKLRQLVFVQRSNKRVSRPRFYSSFYVPDHTKIDEDEFRKKLLSVRIDVEGRGESAHVEFFQGCVDSIQFKQPAKFYAGKAIKVVGVEVGNPSLSHAAAIDRCEHGKEP